MIGIPEITAAKWSGWLPFTTISTMTGHLERHHTWVELIVVALIVLVIFSLMRSRPAYRIDTAEDDEANRPAGAQPERTPGGRLTAATASDERTPRKYDEDPAPFIFTVCAVVSLAAIAIGTWAATKWWDDPRHFQPAYVLYGSLGPLWVAVPSFVALVFQKDVPFPTLFRTIGNLEDWLSSRRLPWLPGPKLAWLVAYVIFAGLAILLLHLTLYPYPEITHILNPNG